MIEKIQGSMTSGMDELRKAVDSTNKNVKAIQAEIEEIKSSGMGGHNNNDDDPRSMSSPLDNGEGGGTSKAQQAFNSVVEKKLVEFSERIESLARMDKRLNKEQVQKPYDYINKVKDNLDKEQKEIVNIINKNNEKYVSKMGQLDHKIGKVLIDTETLLDQYRKKIGEIGKNLESTKRFRNETDRMVEKLEERIDKAMTNCDGNHTKMSGHIDRISLKFAENTVDLQAAGEGFQREIERVQIIFRELQGEFLTTLEEKRAQNESLLRAGGVKDSEITKASETAKGTTAKNLSVLLPKIKKSHLDSTL